MNFEQRALRARKGGAAVRAAVLLIEGLKRHPAEQDALELLCEIYVEDIDSSGLEPELARVLVRQSDPNAYFSNILDALRGLDKISMGRELIRAAAEEGWETDWPPLRVEAPPQPEPTAPTEAALAEDAIQVAIQVNEERDVPTDGAQADADAPHLDEAEGAEVDIASEDAPLEVAPEVRAPVVDAAQTPQKIEPPPIQIPSKPARAPGARRVWLLALLIIIVLGAGATWWWSAAPASSGAGGVDATIERSDPALEGSASAIFGDAAPHTDDVDEMERRAFVAAVHAADRGEESVPVSTRETAWGLASAATYRALRGEFEQALSESARLERQYPGTLATYWARGFVAESRGQFAGALTHYLAGQERFPAFAPFLSAQLRIALRQARAEQARELQQELATLSPENPYTHLEIALPTLADFEGGQRGDAKAPPSGVLPVERPRFVRAMQHLERAMSAIQRGDWPQARTQAEASLKADAMLASALLVAGVLRAGDLDVAGADAALARVAQTPGMSPAYRWMLQVVAPRALSSAGRPDLGYKYAVQVKALGKVDPRERAAFEEALDAAGLRLPEALVPLLSVEDRLQDTPLAREAIFARVEVLNELGLTRAAIETLELLDGVADVQARRAQMRIRIAIRNGHLRQARALAARLNDAPWGDGARAEIAYYSGDYAEALDLAGRAFEHTPSVEALRVRALSELARGRGRVAGSWLRAAPPRPLQRGALRALKMRVERGGLANDSDTHSADNTIFEGFLALQPTSVERLLDLANHAFWQKDFKRARTLAERALRLADADPGAHWMMGLVEHISGQESAADRHFRAAWRSDPSDPLLLIEMGRIYLGMEQPRRAQRAFYRAILRDRTSTAAIQGLGQAYLGYARSLGVRDLSRILQGYEGTSKYLAQSVETLRWLAILSGSRDGKAEGLAYLERAVSMIGESADLLMELAQYRSARGESNAARKLFARVLEKDSTRADARIGIARMAIEAGDEVSATAQLRRYLRFAPEGRDAQWAQATLERLSGAGEAPKNTASHTPSE